MSLNDLIDQALAIIQMRGYTKSTWELTFRNGRFSSLRKYFEDRNMEDFDVELARGYIAETQKNYEEGGLSYSRAAHLKKLAAWLIELHETGELQWGVQVKSKVAVNTYFEVMLNRYLDSLKGILSFTNIRGQKSEILHWLGFLQNGKGHRDFTSITAKDVQDYIPFLRERRNGRLDRVIYSMKRFLTYLWGLRITTTDLTTALYLPAQKPRRILASFTHEEVDHILAQPNRSTAIGKRDYAILMLGRSTGLRIGDIIKMRLTDIDWKNDEVTIAQSKTGNTLVLPLEADTENAIIDYIRSGRPKCDLPYLFLRHNAPYNSLSQQTVTVFFMQYRTAAGISHVSGDGRSFHGLRRSIASWMLEADIPLTTISQVLGHRHIDSIGSYLSIDEKNLRKCGLSLEGIEVCKEGLV